MVGEELLARGEHEPLESADEDLNETFSTGGVATLLNDIEPRLSELIRRGKITPAPRVVAGRRIWELDHVLQAARLLGHDPDAVLRRIVSREAP